jgi:hypothetical protein
MFITFLSDIPLLVLYNNVADHAVILISLLYNNGVTFIQKLLNMMLKPKALNFRTFLLRHGRVSVDEIGMVMYNAPVSFQEYEESLCHYLLVNGPSTEEKLYQLFPCKNRAIYFKIIKDESSRLRPIRHGVFELDNGYKNQMLDSGRSNLDTSEIRSQYEPLDQYLVESPPRDTAGKSFFLY